MVGSPWVEVGEQAGNKSQTAGRSWTLHRGAKRNQLQSRNPQALRCPDPGAGAGFLTG